MSRILGVRSRTVGVWDASVVATGEGVAVAPVVSCPDVQAASENMIATAAERPVRVFILLLPSREKTDQHSQEYEPPAQLRYVSSSMRSASPERMILALSDPSAAITESSPSSFPNAIADPSGDQVMPHL
jgi:hypothetical protein